jgi:hypothetical protein
MKIIALVLGVIAALLGALWLLQGLGVVQIEPIACVGECAPLQGPSMQWAITGAIVLAVGVLGVFYGLRRPR